MNFIKLIKEDFETSAEITPQFNTFYKVFTKEMTALFKELNSTKHKFSKGHFNASAFFQLGEQTWYLSIGDVRWSKEKMLIRTVRDFKDLESGPNSFVAFDENFKENFIKRIKK